MKAGRTVAPEAIATRRGPRGKNASRPKNGAATPVLSKSRSPCMATMPLERSARRTESVGTKLRSTRISVTPLRAWSRRRSRSTPGKMSGTSTTWIGCLTCASMSPPTSQLPRWAVSRRTPLPASRPSTMFEYPETPSTRRAASSGGRVAKCRKSTHAEKCETTISNARRRTSAESSGAPRMTARLVRAARRYLGRSR